ncbi:hypothetical protein BLA60_40630 [Actinophytocola xinjiangensis]|uniref:ABC3 transporter permease C-terminal domain-containing protein n=1 Tax=Actinophytocola xinjiangensis TaxID=485602 RepID=A0A7Z0WDX7_9PSEU|nr:FtsX-like permease family protein [Actinophytocola xinjiangensis]OLF04494.1 hypothetical protein BLA60_40630 [Actinophytocola xinjiangensis]
MRRWAGDLALGLRLAVSGRSSLTRFLLSAVGIAIGVAVLLVGASVGNIAHQHQVRDATTSFAANSDVPVDGVDPLYWSLDPTVFHGDRVERFYVHAAGENAPVPPGLDRVPAPGEQVVSPALADLLSSPEGELLTPRLSAEVIGTLPDSAVPEPGDLITYVGADASFVGSDGAVPTYGFDPTVRDEPLPPEMLVVLTVGVVVLLLPVFIFVSTSARVAGAERDRRLSALRLVGAGARQVRRISAAEAVVSALAGLVLGAGLFLFVRLFAEDIELSGRRVYREDVVPDPVLAVLIVLAVPGLAVATAQFAMRRTIIEPLGVVRYARPVRRRGWWRLALVTAGVAALLYSGSAGRGSDLWIALLVVGTALLLVGVPVLLPWLVERVVRRLSGGPSSWQLAIRRLQLDSGTAARVVGGVAVVLAGAIALQTILMTAETSLGDRGISSGKPSIEVLVSDESLIEPVVEDLSALPSVRGAYAVSDETAFVAGREDRPDLTQTYLSVMDCDAVRALAGATECTDGDVFARAGYEAPPAPGTSLEFRDYVDPVEGADVAVGPVGDEYEVTGTWTVPKARNLPESPNLRVGGTLIVTPGALGGVVLPDVRTMVHVDSGELTGDDVERIRNAVAAHEWRIYTYVLGDVSAGSARQAFTTVSSGLYGGAVFTLLVAGVSLLVLALEHIRERRRPLAVLVASGVPKAVLGRSLLWQVVLPILLGVVVAVVTGVGLAWLVVRSMNVSLAVDWLGVGVLSAGSVLLAVAVSALTLPFLRSATRLTSLRTE